MLTTTQLHEMSWSRPAGTSPLIGAEETSQPLLDHKVLDKLREDLDEFEVWRVFVQNFITALPLRIESVRLTLTTGDAVGAMDAVLSLKSASQMVGAGRLASLAYGLEVAQREGIRVAAPSVVLPQLAVDHLQRIKQRAEQTSYVLEAHLRTAP
ncbi:Hpt domain-containing protein [Pseudarthrobacter sulfonivorans]|uniref:Hpt domain-containing protein n=1 Tax=Pseudarthrobacter sulfonivorans TaxID=121292 RepID=UPI002854E2CE|nr:Hpt domain-containing protein [Pseudarthrobacter sulfonivorans]MDR6416402.1 HPt (histidine-containing phosphotransfer) domain-containing protein [Pseudarthrobacter sulfonivorans]